MFASSPKVLLSKENKIMQGFKGENSEPVIDDSTSPTLLYILQ